MENEPRAAGSGRITEPDFDRPHSRPTDGMSVRFGKSLISRVLLAFGALVTLIFAASIALQNSKTHIENDIAQITEVEEVITAAAFEMEINAIGTGLGVLSYMDEPSDEARARVRKDEADFESAQRAFDSLASSSAERELAAQAGGIYNEFKELGAHLMNQKDDQESLFDSVSASFARIDQIVDEQLQPIIDTESLSGLEKSIHAVEMELNAAEVGAWAGSYLRVGSPQYRDRIAEDTSDFWEALARYEEEETSTDERRLLVELESLFASASAGVDEALRMHDDIRVDMTRFIALREQLDGVLDDEIQLLAEEALLSARADARVSTERMGWVINTMIIFGLGIAATGATILVRRFAGPVRRLTHAVKEIGQGNLSYRLEEGNDELGIVAGAFNKMAVRRAQAESRMEQLVRDLERSDSGHLALIEAIPDSMMMVDASGVVIEARMTSDSTFPELEGRDLAEALSLDASAEFREMIVAALANGGAETFEYQFSVNGSKHDFEIRMVPIEGSENLVLINRDVTEQRRAKPELEGLVESKNRFLASVTHELRTPLSAVVGFAELLATPQADMEEHEKQEMARLIAEQAVDLGSLVDDLLVVARTEIGDIDVAVKPVPLRGQTGQTGRILSVNQKLEIHDGESITALGDPARIRQIIRNLMSNASKYGGDHVHVEIGADDSVAHLRILDDGEGLPNDQWERIFEPYEKAHDLDVAPSSVGIGLAISRRLARLMDGDLTYSYADGWSTFELTLPAA